MAAGHAINASVLYCVIFNILLSHSVPVNCHAVAASLPRAGHSNVYSGIHWRLIGETQLGHWETDVDCDELPNIFGPNPGTSSVVA